MCWGAGAYPRKVHLVLCHLLPLNIRKMALNVDGKNLFVFQKDTLA
jgi:hypothetical protein